MSGFRACGFGEVSWRGWSRKARRWTRASHSRRLLMRRARRIPRLMISFLVTGERRPKMSKEKWDLSEFAAEHRVNETSAIEVEFGGTAASLFEHLRLAPSGEIPVHNTTSPFEMSCRRVDCGLRSEPPFGARSAMREGEYFATDSIVIISLLRLWFVLLGSICGGRRDLNSFCAALGLIF